MLAGGVLEHDREFAFFDGDGKFLNGKRTPKIHGLRSAFDLHTGDLRLAAAGTREEGRFHLPDDQEALESWLTRYFGQPVFFRRNPQGGFPDDRDAPGPTIISTATLEEVASWFPGLSVASARTRFRANLEIGGVPPFWEDRLFGGPETVVPFGIGDVTFHGVNPCQRCIVPPRDPETGEAIPDFSPVFRARREETLPPGLPASDSTTFTGWRSIPASPPRKPANCCASAMTFRIPRPRLCCHRSCVVNTPHGVKKFQTPMASQVLHLFIVFPMLLTLRLEPCPRGLATLMTDTADGNNPDPLLYPLQGLRTSKHKSKGSSEGKKDKS